MLKNKKILLIILMVVLLLLIPNIVKADEENIVIPKINITGPSLIVGKELYKTEDYNVVIENLTDVEINLISVTWQKYNYETEKYEEDTSSTFEVGKQYRAYFNITISNNIAYGDPTCKVNDNDAILCGLGGEEGFNGYQFFCQCGRARPEKVVEIVNITGPNPIVGKELYKAEDYNAVAENLPDVNINLISVMWQKYNEETEQYEEDTSAKFEEGKKYRAYFDIDVSVDNSYGDPTCKVNGKDATLCGLGGTEEINGYQFYYDFGLATTGEENTETKTPTVDNTKAKGTIPYTGGTLVILLSSTLLVIAGVYAYKKTKDLKGV